jgi:hypothetical protein
MFPARQGHPVEEPFAPRQFDGELAAAVGGQAFCLERSIQYHVEFGILHRLAIQDDAATQFVRPLRRLLQVVVALDVAAEIRGGI